LIKDACGGTTDNKLAAAFGALMQRACGSTRISKLAVATEPLASFAERMRQSALPRA
jgi:hypothetical protein